MTNQKTRRLAAIMFTDIVGYTALMQENEQIAAAARARHRQVFNQNHQTYKGEILQYYGDGTLSVFYSVVEAVECAIAIQSALKMGDAVPIRIGLHMGDIVFDGTEVYGDGVNLAARIESMGVGGAILLSKHLNDELKNHKHISTISMGHFELKHIAQPVEVYAVANADIRLPHRSELKGKQTVQNKSIAVLPFVNMSTSAENEYFSDGITEEIINALTTVQGLKVIARTSSFAFKGKNVDVRTIGNQLGVATILEGSVRKVKNRVRITAQLVNTEDGAHLWSKNFNREMEDIFALQDEISLLIADQIRENYGHIEIKDQLIKAPTKNIEAYNLYLKARYHQLKWNGEGIREGIKYYKQCIAIDVNYSLAYFGIGYCYAMFASWGFQKENLEIADNYLKKGFQLDNQSYLGYFGKATLNFWGKWDFKNSHQYFKHAIALNSFYTEAEEGLTELYTALGYFTKAQQHAHNMLAINPLSPNHYFTKGNIYFLSQSFHKAVECMEMALQIDPNFLHAIEWIQLCYIQLKDYQKLNDFLNTNPLVERPELCRALYKLVNPDEDIAFDLKAVQLKINDKIEVTLIPWQLFLHVHLGNIELAFDILENAVEKRQGQYINFKNTPLLNPLHGHQRFEKLIQTTFPTNLLPKEKDLDESKSLFRKKEKKNLISEEELTTILKQLEQFMEVENLFTDTTLSLRQLAEKLNLNTNKLSWLLNTHIGKNFSEYINSCRLVSFKKNALDPANSHLTLLGLAYESGFNSKTVFNSFFKKTEGMTPSAWVKLKK